MANTGTTAQKSGGVGFLGLLALLFIGLKLTGYIAWSWWWVLSPIWIPFVLVLIIWIIAILIIGLVEWMKQKK